MFIPDFMAKIEENPIVRFELGDFNEVICKDMICKILRNFFCNGFAEIF
jgi:hypothetical protein